MKPSYSGLRPTSYDAGTNMPRLTDFRRIVVKVGSSLLVDAKTGRLNGGRAEMVHRDDLVVGRP